MVILVSAVHHLISFNVKKLAQTSEHDGSVLEGLFEVIGESIVPFENFQPIIFNHLMTYDGSVFEICNLTEQLNNNRIKV